MKDYRIAVNLEWTSKCNAMCAMCPRDMVKHPRKMKLEVFKKILDRISPTDTFRGVIAGYGEPTTHPKFEQFVDMVRHHPVPFDLVTNGQLLDEDRLDHIDGAVGLLMISFSSVAPAVYNKVHVKLDLERVMKNVAMAQKRLKKTTLAISLTPMGECLETLDETIRWLHSVGVAVLTMSPTLYDRAGTMNADGPKTKDLRGVIKKYGLHSQELDFIPTMRETLAQRFANKFKCTPRNSDMLISSDGDYMYCFNDIAHRRPIGSVKDISLRDAIHLREKMPADPELCTGCNINKRYGPGEMAGAAIQHIRARLRDVPTPFVQ